MAEIDLNKFRGFKTYQKELPAAPATPLFGIKAWLSFELDDDSGLLRCEHYLGEDYTDGDWPQYVGIPELYVGDGIGSHTASIKISKDGVGSDTVKFSIPVPDSLGIYRIGCLFEPHNIANNGYVSLFAVNGNAVVGVRNVDPTFWYLGIYRSGWNEVATAIYPSSYIEAKIDTETVPETPTITVYVNGTSIHTESITRWGVLETIGFVQGTNEDYGSGKYCLYNNLIVTDGTEIYNSEYNGASITTLMEYPKLAAPSITTHPESQSILEGGTFNELTVVALDGGGTLTYQWQSYSGSTWSDIEGETDDAYTPTEAGTYRVGVTNSINTVYSNSAVLVEQTFAYSQTTTISHALAPTNQQVMFTINRSSGTSSGMTIYVGTNCETDYADIRFYCDDVLLDYWIEPDYTSSSAKIWVKFPAIADTNLDLVIKYGNSEVTSDSDMTIFPFYESCNGSSLDTDKWELAQGTGTTISVSGGVITLTGASGEQIRISAKTNMDTDYAFRARVKTAHYNATSRREWFGLYDLTGGYFEIIANSNDAEATAGKYYQYNSVGVIEASSGITADTWQTYEIQRNGSTNVKYLVDDGNTVTISSDIPSTGLPAIFLAKEAGSVIYLDWVVYRKYIATAPTIGSWTATGDILFGTHFDDESDWNTSQDASLLNDWDQKLAENRGGSYEVGYIAQNGEASGKCFKQLWDTTSGTGAQDCWLIKNSITIPDEFWLGYRFKVDTNWDWGSVDHFKIMKLHFDNGTTWDIGWHSSDYGMTSPYTPPGGGLAIGTDAYGDNWFCSWGDIDDGDWHTFVWHMKHSTGTLELFVDGIDAALTSKSTAYVGTGWDDGSESGYALSFGGNIENGGGGVSEMWDKYDDVCIGTTRAKVEEYLGI